MTEIFKAFAAKFTRLGYITKYNERYLVRILKKKLFNRLFKFLATLSLKKDFTTLRELKIYLTKLNNTQRLNLSKAIASSKAFRTASKSTAYVISTNRVKAADLIITIRPIKNTRLATYYNYEKIGHLKSNCLNKDKEQIEAGKGVVAVRINEVKIDKI